MESIKIQKYPAYKDSGTEWLGEVPERWKVTKVKNVFRLVMEPSPKNNDFELLSVYTDIGVKPRKELEERGNKASTTDGYWFVKKGDIVVNKLLAWMGAIGVSNYDGVTSPAYDILRAKVQLESNFYHYLFRNGACVSELKKHSRGIMDMRLRLYFDKFGDVMIPFPDYSEQQKIVSFLDRKTALIDQAVGIKEKQIELLKERRQILIHRAVTRGLNSDVKLKDSGVEWIGEIPEHWEVARVKQCSNKISKGTTPSTEGRSILDEGPIRYIKAENIQDGCITNYPAHFIDKKTNSLIRRSELQEDDILFVIAGATLGKVAIVSKVEIPSNTNQAVAFVRPNSKVIPQYLSIWLTSSIIKELIWIDAVQSAQPNLSMEDLGNFPIFLPGIVEQKLIVSHIEILNTKIATAISLKEQEIEKLKEYKASLINEAVTGKIKVG